MSGMKQRPSQEDDDEFAYDVPSSKDKSQVDRTISNQIND